MNKWSVYVCLYVLAIAIIGLIYFKIQDQDWRERKKERERDHRDDD